MMPSSQPWERLSEPFGATAFRIARDARAFVFARLKLIDRPFESAADAEAFVRAHAA